MKTVAVFRSDEITLRRLVLGFRNRCAVRAFSTIESLEPLVASGSMTAIIVDMRPRTDIPDRTPVDFVAQLHATYPLIPIVGYTDLTPQSAYDVFGAGQRGILRDLILRESDNLEAVATRILNLSASIDISARIKAAIEDMVPETLQDFFDICITQAGKGITVESVTSQLRRNRKTLSNRLTAAALPPPYRIVGWMRVLIATRMLEDSSQSTEKVARDLTFVSGTALRNMMRRYLGIGPETLRRQGGFTYALSKFVEELRSSKRSPKAPTGSKE